MRFFAVVIALLPSLSHSLSLAPHVVAAGANNVSFDLIGCYFDDFDRAFSGGFAKTNWDSNTVDKCKEWCKNSCYMSIQYGGECFCDNSPKFTSPYEQVPLTECQGAGEPNPDCSVQFGCGGTWRNSVYANSGIWSSRCTDKSPGPLSKVQWKLCNDNGSPTAFSSNLGGLGPNTGAKEEFRISGIGTVNGVVLDLVITVADGEKYKSYTQEQQTGAGGAYVSPCPAAKCEGARAEPIGPPCFGVIPFEVKTQTKFNWKFVKANTSQVYEVPKFGVTVYDIDRERDDWDGKGPDVQFLEFNTATSELHHGPSVKVTKFRNGVSRVESLKVGNLKDNPTISGPPMTEEQHQRSVDAVYTNRGEWEITVGHANGDGRFDRSVVFSGYIWESIPPAPTPAPTPLPTPSPTPRPTPRPTTPFMLEQGQNLERNQMLLSTNGRYRAILQNDGNFVIYDGSSPIWNTNTFDGTILRLQDDQNLVLYKSNGVAWATNRYNKGGGAVRLIMQDDGNLVEYNQENGVIWASGTHGKR